MLLVDLNLYTCGLSTFPKTSEVTKPFSRAPVERNVRRRRVKKVQLGPADDREIERTVEGSFAGLLQIDCTKDSTEVAIAVSLKRKTRIVENVVAPESPVNKPAIDQRGLSGHVVGIGPARNETNAATSSGVWARPSAMPSTYFL